MPEMYVVYVAAPQKEPTPEERLHLAEVLRLDSSKLDALLRRLPANVTKPVPETTAITVARTFREAGLDASIQPPRPAALAGEPEVRTEEAASQGGWPDQNADEDERQEADKADTENEDVLFPDSSFTPDKGPKAPSKPMLFALFTVVLVLAALWILL